MYRVELVEDKEILECKDFKEYEQAYNYSNGLIQEIKEGRKILMIENKNGVAKVIRKLELEKNNIE